MEQVQQLIDILKETPEMALWGIAMFFLWTLAKMASIVGAISIVLKLAINKFHSYKTLQIEVSRDSKNRESFLREREIKLEESKLKVSIAQRVIDRFNGKSGYDINEESLMELLDNIPTNPNNDKIYSSNIKEAIKTLKENSCTK